MATEQFVEFSSLRWFNFFHFILVNINLLVKKNVRCWCWCDEFVAFASTNISHEAILEKNHQAKKIYILQFEGLNLLFWMSKIWWHALPGAWSSNLTFLIIRVNSARNMKNCAHLQGLNPLTPMWIYTLYSSKAIDHIFMHLMAGAILDLESLLCSSSSSGSSWLKLTSNLTNFDVDLSFVKSGNKTTFPPAPTDCGWMYFYYKMRILLMWLFNFYFDIYDSYRTWVTIALFIYTLLWL